MSDKSLAIIIVNWNGHVFTEACIESLHKSEFQSFDIIVVDNGSDENDVTTLRTRTDIQLLESKINLGFTGGNNLGIQYAMERNYPYIMLLNNDTIIERNAIDHLINALLENNDLGAVQPKIYYLHDDEKIWNAGGRFNRISGRTLSIGEGVTDIGQFDEDRYVDWVTGCCILIHSTVIEKIGLLDDRFFAYFEDVDWSLRMRKNGFRLKYIHQSHIFHVAGAAGKSRSKNREGYINPIIHYFNFRNQFYMLRKHQNGFFLITSVGAQILRSLIFMVYFAVRLRHKKLKYTIKGVIDGLGNNL